MKLLIATGIYPPDIGGPATYSKLLYDELPRHGFTVKVLSFGKVRHLPKFVSHLIYTINLIRAGKKADLLYAQDPVSVGLPTYFASRILRKPYVLKIVGDYAWEQGSIRFGVTDILDIFSKKKAGYGISVYLLKIIQSFVARNAKKIIVPSNYLQGIISNWGIRKERILVIYNSFSPKESLERDFEVHKKHLIVSVGRLVPWKGFAALIEIMPSVLKKYPDTRLNIIGDGPEKDNLKTLIKKNNLEEYIRLSGKLSRDDMFKRVMEASVFVLNTNYEGFSHQLLEVMYLKTPIITTDVGGNPELIENNKTGILIDYNDVGAIENALVQIFSDSEKARALTEAASEKTKEFSKDRMINGLINELV